MVVKELLEQHYNAALALVDEQVPTLANAETLALVRKVVDKAESAKGVLAVLLTSVVYKVLHPEQDIRKHQTSIEGGYSGRTFDSANITPYLKEKSFPAMSESGWLTRSLEQKVPYDEHYTGAITHLEKEFLTLIATIEKNSIEANTRLLHAFFKALILWRDASQIIIATPSNLTIKQILDLLRQHFEYKYHDRGTSRLPCLALYATYEVLVSELKRFKNKRLLGIAKHNSADMRSGRMGDVDVVNEVGEPFEAVEIKFGIAITEAIVNTAYQKFMGSAIERYYILSTAHVEDAAGVEERIQAIKNTHGCQVIVNGVYHTLGYYLRLMNDPKDFVRAYANCLATDEAIKYEHKEMWNALVAQIK